MAPGVGRVRELLRMDGAEDRINLDTVRLMKALYGFMKKKLRIPWFGTRRPDRYILLTPPSVTPFSL